jgi:hypothetical protein
MYDYISKWMYFISYGSMFAGIYIFFFRVYDNRKGRFPSYIDFSEYHQIIGGIIFLIGIALFFKTKKDEKEL